MPAFVQVVGLCWGNLVRQTPCCPALKEAHRQRYLTTLDSVTAHEKAAMFTQIVLAGIVTHPLRFLSQSRPEPGVHDVPYLGANPVLIKCK